MPSYGTLHKTVLDNLGKIKNLSSKEFDTLIAKSLKLDEETLSILHNATQGQRTEFQYRMAWVRTKAKKKGILTRNEKGEWAHDTN